MTDELSQTPDDRQLEPEDVQQYWRLFNGKSFYPIRIVKDALTLFGIGSQGSVRVGKGADVASAASITLGNGNVFAITGTTKISTIAAKDATTPVLLRFAAAGCQVEDRNLSGSGNVYLSEGHYVSTAGGTLTLFGDGTNWYEAGRSGGSALVLQFSRASAQTIADTTGGDTSTATYVRWDRTTGWPYGGTGYSPWGDEFPDGDTWLDAGNSYEITLKVPGVYLILFKVTYEPSAGGGNAPEGNLGRRKVWIEKYDPAAALAANPAEIPDNYWFAAGDGNEMVAAEFTDDSHAWTNNIASGGSNNVAANFTDLSTYSNSASTIRNDLYQIANKLGQLCTVLDFDRADDPPLGNERTLVGFTITRSDGTNKVRLLTWQDSGSDLDLSGESYETNLQLVRLGG